MASVRRSERGQDSTVCSKSRPRSFQGHFPLSHLKSTIILYCVRYNISFIFQYQCLRIKTFHFSSFSWILFHDNQDALTVIQLNIHAIFIFFCFTRPWHWPHLASDDESQLSLTQQSEWPTLTGPQTNRSWGNSRGHSD